MAFNACLKQEAFEKCWAHSPLRSTAPHYHSPGVASHAACASMSTTTTVQRMMGPLWPHGMGPMKLIGLNEVIKNVFRLASN